MFDWNGTQSRDTIYKRQKLLRRLYVIIIPPTITDLAISGCRKQTLLVQNITDALSNARVESKWL